ncbi:MAG TPA: hypothetical protein VLZ83_02030 [Edaphocola sp.]|nr:hypothetical protein [Edaphocola sp.]
MRKLLSLIILSFLSYSLLAQVDEETTTLHINGYAENTAVSIIPNNKLKVQNKEVSDTFILIKKDNKLSLNSSSDSAKFLSILNLDYNLLNESLIDQAGNNAIDKLIDITSKMKGQKLILKSGELAPEISENVEEGQAIKQKNDLKLKSWIFPLLIGLGGIGLGFIMGKGSRKDAPKSVPAPSKKEPIVKAEPFTESVVTSNNNEKALKKELVALKEKNDLITSKTKDLIEGDNIFYTAAFEKVLLPLQKALDEGDQSEVVKYTNLSMIYLSSITRVKIRKKQNYDDANIQLLIGNNSFTKDFPEIDFQTSLDKIPANLRVLMEILETHNVKSLGDTIIKGYKIKG